MKIILLLLSISTFFACKTAEKTITPEENIIAEKTIEFIVLKTGDNCGYKKADNIIAHQIRGLDILWGELFINYDRKPPIPIIDFEHKEVLVVTMGEQNSGGYSITVNSILETKKNIVITIEELKPGESCMTTSVMTYPFQMIEMTKSNKEIIYNRVEKIYNCGK